MTTTVRSWRKLPIVTVIVLAGMVAPLLRGSEEVLRGRFTVEITNPPAGDFVFGVTELQAEVKADDLRFIAKVEFYVDDVLIFIDKEEPYEVTYDFGEEPGSFVIRVDAYHVDNIVVSDTRVTKRLVINYQVGVDRVVLNATALDGKGDFVRDLTSEDLTLLEDKVPQQILNFYLEERPITMALVLDTSGSMRDAIDESQIAADSFVDTLKEQDRAMVIDFDEKVFLLQNLTDDKDELKMAIDSTYAQGGTAIYDALFSAFRILNQQEGRRAIILLTDGEDSASQFSYQRIQETARTSNVVIYTIGLGTSLRKGPLRELAAETGGRAFFPGSAHKLRDVYDRVAMELRSQYYLSYSSSNKEMDGSFRKIILNASRSGVDLRTRKGYYAVP
jgi:Ca-activated chloride channel homolog